MRARWSGRCLLGLLLTLPASAQVPQQAGAQAPPSMPPPRAPAAARPIEGSRVVKRDVAKATGAGNAALLEGRHGDARASYEQAQVLAPELAELEYNRGVSLLLEGDFEGAERALEQGVSLSWADDAEGLQRKQAVDPALVGDGQFNLGHAAFGKQELDAAARRFATALAARPGSDDARRNLELVLRAIQDQQEQEQEQQDDQQQDDQQQDEQDQQEQQDQSGEQEQQEPQDDEQQQEQPQPDQPQPDQPQEQPQEQQPQPRPGEMSREQIEQLLDALAEEERDALKRQQEAQKKEALPAPGGKDW